MNHPPLPPSPPDPSRLPFILLGLLVIIIVLWLHELPSNVLPLWRP